MQIFGPNFNPSHPAKIKSIKTGVRMPQECLEAFIHNPLAQKKIKTETKSVASPNAFEGVVCQK